MDAEARGQPGDCAARLAPATGACLPFLLDMLPACVVRSLAPRGVITSHGAAASTTAAASAATSLDKSARPTRRRGPRRRGAASAPLPSCRGGGGDLGELRNPPPAVAKAGPLVASTPSAPGSGLIKVRAILGSTPAQHTHYFVCSLRVVAQPLRLVELGTDALHLAQQTQLKWPGPTTERSSKSAKAF